LVQGAEAHVAAGVQLLVVTIFLSSRCNHSCITGPYCRVIWQENCLVPSVLQLPTVFHALCHIFINFSAWDDNRSCRLPADDSIGDIRMLSTYWVQRAHCAVPWRLYRTLFPVLDSSVAESSLALASWMSSGELMLKYISPSTNDLTILSSSTAHWIRSGSSFSPL